MMHRSEPSKSRELDSVGKMKADKCANKYANKEVTHVTVFGSSSFVFHN
jgi:hypothetical protein